MALPTSIANASIANTSGNALPCKSAAGNIYFPSFLTTLMKMFKATDPTSSFALVGTGATMANNVNAVAAYQVSDVIHVVTSSVTTFHVGYHTFNMATDAWVITDETVIDPSATPALPTINAVSIKVRSDGSVVVLYNGTQETVGTNFDRIKAAVRASGGGWTTDIDVAQMGVAAHYRYPKSVLGASDRVHIFFADTTNTDMYQRTMKSDNSLESFPSAFDANGGVPGNGCSYVSGGATKIRVPYRNATSGKSAVAKCDSADAPTVTHDDNVGDAAQLNAIGSCLTVADGTDLYLLYVNTSDNDLYSDKNADGAGWGTDISQYVGSVGRISANVYQRGADVVMGYMFFESSVKYNEIFLRTPSVGRTRRVTTS